MEKRSEWYDSQPVNLGSRGIFKRKELYPFMDADGLDEAVILWKDYKRFGLAHGKGAAEETEEYMSLIRAFEDEYDDAVREKTLEAREAGRKR